MKRISPPMVIVVGLLLEMLVHVTRLRAAEPILLVPELPQLSMGMHMDILEDPSKQWTIHNIVSEPIAALFTPSRAPSPAFGFTSSAYWVRFAVVNPSDRDIQWYLEIAYPPMDRIDLYIAAPPEQLQSRSFGDQLPFNARDVKFRN